MQVNPCDITSVMAVSWEWLHQFKYWPTLMAGIAESLSEIGIQLVICFRAVQGIIAVNSVIFIDYSPVFLGKPGRV